MSVAEEIVKTYAPDWIDEFRRNEKEAANTQCEGELLWNILVQFGQDTVSLFANSLDKMKAVCEGTSGLSCPSNYYASRLRRSKIFIATDSFFNLRKVKGSNTCSQTLLELGLDGYNPPKWVMHVRSGARLVDLIRMVKDFLSESPDHASATIVVGWAASDLADCLTKNLDVTETLHLFCDLCVLLSHSPRSIILTLGSAHEWALDEKWDELMTICRDEARLYGILTHDFMTVIPRLQKHRTQWGIDPWHFASTDDNKSLQAKTLFDIVTCLELLRPSSIEWSIQEAHSWDCPHAVVRCVCGVSMENSDYEKFAHWKGCQCLEDLRFMDIDWEFLTPVACWSDSQCAKCQIAFEPVSERRAVALTSRSKHAPPPQQNYVTGGAQSSGTQRATIVIDDDDAGMPDSDRPAAPAVPTTEDANVLLTSQSTTAGVEPEVALESDEQMNVDEEVLPVVTTSITISSSCPAEINQSPAIWLDEGKQVSMDTYVELRDAHSSRNKYVRRQTESARVGALMKIKEVAAPVAEEETPIDEAELIERYADQVFAMANDTAQPADETGFNILNISVYQGKWVQVELPDGRKVWKQRKDDAAVEAPAVAPEIVDVAVDELAVGHASFSSASTMRDDEPEFASPTCIDCHHKFKVIAGREQSKFCRGCGTKRIILDAVGDTRADDVTVVRAGADVPMLPGVDLTTQYRRLEIHLLKRQNEFSGLIFAEPESHKHRGGAIHPRHGTELIRYRAQRACD
jgi:hypothetical protein